MILSGNGVKHVIEFLSTLESMHEVEVEIQTRVQGTVQLFSVAHAFAVSAINSQEVYRRTHKVTSPQSSQLRFPLTEREVRSRQARGHWVRRSNFTPTPLCVSSASPARLHLSGNGNDC